MQLFDKNVRNLETPVEKYSLLLLDVLAGGFKGTFNEHSGCSVLWSIFKYEY